MISKILSKLSKNDENIPEDILRSLNKLEKKIGHKFKNPAYLFHALKHRSYTSFNKQERLESNERLEFLGDSVLGFIVAKFLYKLYPEMSEGELSKIRSIIVSGENLSETARILGLGDYILLSETEDNAGGREKDSILEDCMESVIGAIYLDGGIIKSQKFIKREFINNLDHILNERKIINYKSELLELVQSHGIEPPTYTVISEEGPEHEKTFTVNVKISDKIIAKGSSSSKKRAEQNASSNALKLIEDDINFFNHNL